MKLNLTWIPELFYDLIGRLGPGAIVLAAALVMRLGPNEAWTRTLGFVAKTPEKGMIDMGWFYLGLLSLAAYFVAVVLSAVWDGLEKWWNAKLEKKYHPLSPDRPQRTEGVDLKGCANEGLLTRLVNIHIPGEGVRLTKLSAEENLCKTVVTGFFLILALALASPPEWFSFRSAEPAYVIAGMLLTTMACWRWLFLLRDQQHKDLLGLRDLLATGQVPGAAKPAEETPEKRLVAVLSLKNGQESGGVPLVAEAALGISK